MIDALFTLCATNQEDSTHGQQGSSPNNRDNNLAILFPYLQKCMHFEQGPATKLIPARNALFTATKIGIRENRGTMRINLSTEPLIETLWIASEQKSATTKCVHQSTQTLDLLSLP